jgi:hypothetical protein
MSLYYQGSFRLPAIFAYGASTIGCAGGPLLISTLEQKLAQVSVPSVTIQRGWGNWPTAQVTKSPMDLTQGIVDHGDMLLGGLVAYKDRMYWNAYQYYNVDGAGKAYWGHAGEMVRTHFRQGGYLAIVPESLRTAFGGWVIAGKTNAPGSGTRDFASEGPSAYCGGKWLLGYTLKNPVPYATHLWKGANSVGGCGFTKKHLIFIVRVGIQQGDPYGIPIGYRAQCGSDKGYYAPPYRVQAWGYRISDLLAVKHDARKPWDAVPAWRQDLSPYFVTGKMCSFLGGAGFDCTTQTFYIAEPNADTSNDAEAKPVVHVFRVEA